MKGIFSPSALLVISWLVMLPLMLVSPNAQLWAACLFLPPVVAWILGGNRAYPVLAWVIGLNWLSIAADVMGAELSGQPVREGRLGPYDEQAILIGLSALLAIALGMRLGVRLGGQVLRARMRAMPSRIESGGYFDLGHLLVCYAVALVLSQVLEWLAWSIPTLTQPVLAFALLKYVVLYAIAITVFESDRGYSWLVLVVGAEFIIGMIGYFASFKEPVFLLVIAMVSSRRGLASVKAWALGLAGIAAVLWVALVWTAIKFEYRSEMYARPLQERVTWLADRYVSRQIDYGDAATRLLDRVGSTELFAQVLASLDAGAIGNDFNFYRAAIKHVLTPRVLFPDKAALDDSKITTALTGQQIAEDTSIGVGYIAEADVDFGFPGLLLPMLALGFMLGSAAEYFMTRPAPLPVTQAFATATCFHFFFFEADIDKALGGFITAWLAMALALRFGYPLMAMWLAGGPRRKIIAAKRVSAGTAPYHPHRTFM